MIFFVGTALVDMYAKCGLLVKAQEVLNYLPHRNVVSWTTLISGYAEHGHGEEALKCFEQMQLEGLFANAVTFVCILKACGSIQASNWGHKLHGVIVQEGLVERDADVGNALVDMYAKCGLLAEAQVVFDNLSDLDVVSWSALVTGYADHGLGKEALNCFEQMQLDGISPNTVTFVCILKACSSRVGEIAKGLEVHAMITREGLLEKDVVVGNVLIEMYVKHGMVIKAQEVFGKLPVQDAVSWNVLIGGYAQHRQWEGVMNCFQKMQLEGPLPDAVSFVYILNACGSTGAIDKGRKLHAEIVREGVLEDDIVVGNALVDLYFKCGLVTEAQEVFDGLLVRDVVSWNVLITGYALLGKAEAVSYSLSKMIGEGVNPDLVTLTAVLNACSHTGLLDVGHTYFETMCIGYGILPTLEHHTCMVDLFGRAGYLDYAVATIRKMPLSVDLTVWYALLGACQKWGNVKLGKLVREHVVQSNEKDAASYVCMSNIYADTFGA